MPSGYGFPTDAATIDGWVNNADVAAMRGHAWNLWAGMTSASGQMGDGANLPVWETWYGNEDLFPPPSLTAAALPPEASRPRPRALRTFVQPLQFRHNPSHAAAAAAAVTNIVSFNKLIPRRRALSSRRKRGPATSLIFIIGRPACRT